MSGTAPNMGDRGHGGGALAALAMAPTHLDSLGGIVLGSRTPAAQTPGLMPSPAVHANRDIVMCHSANSVQAGSPIGLNLLA